MVKFLNSFNMWKTVIEFKRAESFLAVNLFLQNPRPARKSSFFRIPCGNRESGLTPVNSDACLQISNHTPTLLYINHTSPLLCLWGPAAAGAQTRGGRWLQSSEGLLSHSGCSHTWLAVFCTAIPRTWFYNVRALCIHVSPRDGCDVCNHWNLWQHCLFSLFLPSRRLCECCCRISSLV